MSGNRACEEPTTPGLYWALIDGRWECVLLRSPDFIVRMGVSGAYSASTLVIQWGDAIPPPGGTG